MIRQTLNPDAANSGEGRLIVPPYFPDAAGTPQPAFAAYAFGRDYEPRRLGYDISGRGRHATLIGPKKPGKAWWEMDDDNWASLPFSDSQFLSRTGAGTAIAVVSAPNTTRLPLITTYNNSSAEGSMFMDLLPVSGTAANLTVGSTQGGSYNFASRYDNQRNTWQMYAGVWSRITYQPGNLLGKLAAASYPSGVIPEVINNPVYVTIGAAPAVPQGGGRAIRLGKGYTQALNPTGHAKVALMAFYDADLSGYLTGVSGALAQLQDWARKALAPSGIII